MPTLTYTGNLVVTSCWCGIGLAIPHSLYEEANRNHSKNVYCPLGHSFVYGGQTDAEKLRDQLAFERDMRASVTAELDQAKGSLRATKGVVTRMRKQVAAGDCPYCGQHLRDLKRHVDRRHAEEAARVLAGLDPEDSG